MIYFIVISLVVLALGGVFIVREANRAMVKSLDQVAESDVPQKSWPLTKQSSQ